MIITCEECSTRFALDEALIKPEGSKVRCGQCRHVFTVYPETSPDSEPLEFESIEDTESDDREFTDQDLDMPEDFDFDAPVDIDFDDPDTPQEQPGLDFSGNDDIDFNDQDLDFDQVEIDEDPDLPDLEAAPEPPDSDDADFVLEEEKAPAEDDPEIEENGIEFDAADLEFDEPELEFDDTDLELEAPDLEFEPDQEPVEDISDDTTDIEISFDQEEETLAFEELSLETDTPDSDTPDALESDLEEIEFDTETSEPDLELEFDEDSGADLVFEDDGDPLEEAGPDLEMAKAFDAPPALEDEPDSEPDLVLDESVEETESGLEELPDMAESEKFSDYDQVLEQETEPVEEIPDIETIPEMESGPAAETPPSEIPEDLAPEAASQTGEPDSEPEPTPLIPPVPPGEVRKKRATKKKSGLGTPVKILFLLFLLVIAAYIASLRLGADIPFLSELKIPYLTEMVKPEPPPKPEPKPVPNEASINGRFVSNTTAGELFIVTGRIQNPSAVTYSHIRVKGTLMNKEKAKVGTQTAYCGNIIAEETLRSGNISDINKQLTVKQGKQNTNVNIKPGGSVMFMLVFSNLPENLTNFTVEVMDFQAGGGKK